MGEKAPNPVVWFEIYVDDPGRARSFYEEVLDVELTKIPAGELQMYAFPMNPDGGGSAGALAHHPDVKAGGMSTMVYFSCTDCAVEESRIQAAGGTVVRSKMSIGENGFVTIAQDTEGNSFGLHSLS